MIDKIVIISTECMCVHIWQNYVFPVPVSQLLRTPQCAYANPKPPVHSPPSSHTTTTPVPFGNHKFFKVSVSVLQISSFVSFFKKIYLFILSFCLFRATPATYGVSQARDQIGVVATGLHHNHSSMGSEPCL